MKENVMKLIDFGFKMYRKYESLLKYLFFGVCTTIVNFIVHFSCLAVVYNVYLATCVSWAVAVFFAYLTNRILVFKSETKGFKEIFSEVSKFVGFRVASLGMEEGIMLVMVGMLDLNGTYVKIFAQFLVIMANYAFSKLFIFRKVKEEGC